MSQLENIEAIEKQLWNATDTLRANSNYASNEYFVPGTRLIILRPNAIVSKTGKCGSIA